MNPGKCVLWGPGLEREGDGGPRWPEVVPGNHIVRSIPVVPFGPSAGIKVLGVPVDAPGAATRGAMPWITRCLH